MGEREPAANPPRRCYQWVAREEASLSGEKASQEAAAEIIPYSVPMAFSFRRGRKGPFVSIAPSRAGRRPREAGSAGEAGGRARVGRAEAPREGGRVVWLPPVIAVSRSTEVKNGEKNKP